MNKKGKKYYRRRTIEKAGKYDVATLSSNTLMIIPGCLEDYSVCHKLFDNREMYV
jgi:hypothetical protein